MQGPFPKGSPIQVHIEGQALSTKRLLLYRALFQRGPYTNPYRRAGSIYKVTPLIQCPLPKREPYTNPCRKAGSIYNETPIRNCIEHPCLDERHI